MRASSGLRWASGTAALLRLNARTLELYDELQATGVEFEMHGGGLVFAARTSRGLEDCLAHFEAIAENGYCGRFEVWSGDQIAEREPVLVDELAGAVYAPDERYVRPETLAHGLTEDLRTREVDIVEHAPVRRLYRRNGAWAVEAGGRE